MAFTIKVDSPACLPPLPSAENLSPPHQEERKESSLPLPPSRDLPLKSFLPPLPFREQPLPAKTHSHSLLTACDHRGSLFPPLFQQIRLKQILPASPICEDRFNFFSSGVNSESCRFSHPSPPSSPLVQMKPGSLRYRRKYLVPSAPWKESSFIFKEESVVKSSRVVQSLFENHLLLLLERVNTLGGRSRSTVKVISCQNQIPSYLFSIFIPAHFSAIMLKTDGRSIAIAFMRKLFVITLPNKKVISFDLSHGKELISAIALHTPEVALSYNSGWVERWSFLPETTLLKRINLHRVPLALDFNLSSTAALSYLRKDYLSLPHQFYLIDSFGFPIVNTLTMASSLAFSSEGLLLFDLDYKTVDLIQDGGRTITYHLPIISRCPLFASAFPYFAIGDDHELFLYDLSSQTLIDHFHFDEPLPLNSLSIRLDKGTLSLALFLGKNTLYLMEKRAPASSMFPSLMT